MNALELADALGKEWYPTEWQEAATMLRQQQLKIDNLLENNARLDAEIVAIEKNTDYWADKANWIKNNEPVAYVSTTGLNDIEWTDKSHLLNYGDALYTHPVKEQELLNEIEDLKLQVKYLKGCKPNIQVVAELEALKSHPVKELTQNIMDIYRLSDQSIQIVFTSCRSASEFEAILRKEQDK